MLRIASMLLPLFVFSNGALAAVAILANPEAMECKQISNPGYAACNIWYEGTLIFEGIPRGPADAGADCAVCRNFKATAVRLNRHIALDRTLNWDSDGFLTLTDDDVPAPPASPCSTSGRPAFRGSR